MTRSVSNHQSPHGFSPIRLSGLFLIFAGLLLPLASGVTAQEGTGEGVVYALKIEGTIDLGLAHFLKRVIDEAEDDPEARAVLIEIDTPGGRLDAALQMRKAMLDARLPTIAFINREAFSAGALIAIAANEIYIAPGGVIGAATPVDGVGEAASEKVVSAVRKTFKSTAEERGRNPVVAEAMVDPDVEVEGLVETGKLLTLTTEEALEWGYADGVANSRADALDLAGYGDSAVVSRSPGLAERFVRLITEPVIASLLFSIGTLLIIGDFLVGGVGFVAVAGAGMVALVFWGHFLAGLAGWEGVALVVLGLALVAVEVLLIPGLGIAGVLGTVSMLAGLYLTVAGRDITTGADTRRALTAAGVAFVVLLVGAIGALFLLPQAARFRGVALQSRLARSGDEKPTRDIDADAWRLARPSPDLEGQTMSLIGATGVAQSDLRPGGIAEIEGQRVDVVSEGGYISSGTSVVIVRDEGYRRIVRELDNDAE